MSDTPDTAAAPPQTTATRVPDPPPLVEPLQACRVCGSGAIRHALNLGDMLVSTFPDPKTTSDLDRFVRAPLHIIECADCNTAQLAHTVRPDVLFQRDYWYASGINGTMREELRNVVREARQWVRIADGDWVLDIGANDGTLLRSWHEHLWEGRPYRMAVEPSPTFARVLPDTCEAVISELFPCKPLEGSPGQFKVITSIAMFYAVPNPVEFAAEVRRLLAPGGVWIVQMQDLHNMVRATAFDNICHEHLMYYSIQTFWEVVRRAGLRILSYQPREINGGSLRFVVGHDTSEDPGPPAHQEPPSVDWHAFELRMNELVWKLQDTVNAAHSESHTVDLLGASTKGNTLLQIAGLGPAQIRRCWERHPLKVGRHTITGIPIVHEDEGRGGKTGLGSSPGDQAPQLLVCPIWQFRGALIEREHEFLTRGGRIYFPLPSGELYFGKE